MNDMTEMLDQLILQVTQLKGPSAVVVFIIMFCYMLKMWRLFPNRFIPIVGAILGPILTLILVGPPGTGSLAPNLFWPDLAAHVSCIVTGFLLFCVAWIMHAKFLRKLIDDKVPELNPGRVVSTSTSESKVESEAGTQQVQQESKTIVNEPTDKP